MQVCTYLLTYLLERQRAGVDDHSEHGRDDVAQRLTERPVTGQLHATQRK